MLPETFQLLSSLLVTIFPITLKTSVYSSQPRSIRKQTTEQEHHQDMPCVLSALLWPDLSTSWEKSQHCNACLPLHREAALNNPMGAIFHCLKIVFLSSPETCLLLLTACPDSAWDYVQSWCLLYWGSQETCSCCRLGVNHAEGTASGNFRHYLF